MHIVRNLDYFNVLEALRDWAAIVGVLAASVLFLGLLFAVLLHGSRGFGLVFSGIAQGFVDLLLVSPRRVWAMTMLVFKELARKKTLLVIVVFGLLFMFAGWYMGHTDDDPMLMVNNYVSFVLTAISYLIMPSVFLLACWGLPDDIKARSLHTVVTKPARLSEVLYGRLFGVSLVGTLVLALMSVVGYVWLIRALPGGSSMVAKVPVFGDFNFRNREGKLSQEGTNIGDVTNRWGYIEGNTKAAGIYDFENVTPRLLDEKNNLVFESKILAFRTHKGNMGQGVLCQLVLVNEDKKLRAPTDTFELQEFRETLIEVPSKLTDDQNRPVDVLQDLVQNGKLRVEVVCRSSGQYLGMARPDLFLRDIDASFGGAYFKACLGIWSLMELLIVFAVTASTVLKGPIAMLATGIFLVLGLMARDFMKELLAKEWDGGGVLESVYRLVTHMGPTVDLPQTMWTPIIKNLDRGPMALVWTSQYITPNLEYYHLSPYVAKGFDVPLNGGIQETAGIIPAFMTTLAYTIPCLILGYMFLKTRELESK